MVWLQAKKEVFGERNTAIDPFREFTETLASYLRQHPQEKFGCFFDLGEGEDITYFDSAIIKFGRRGFEAMIDHLPMPHDLEFSTRTLYPFMEAALCPNCALSVIYSLLRQAPELIPRKVIIECDTLGPRSHVNAPFNKKQKIHYSVDNFNL